MVRHFFALLFFLQLSTAVNAQYERTIYQVFEVDSVKTVDIDFVGIYEIHNWAGNTILLETHVLLSHITESLMNYLIQNGRYDVLVDSTGLPDHLTLRTKDRVRSQLKRPDGEVTEVATARIFIPDTFAISEDKKRLERKEK